jgi:hypothetical protein
MPRPVYIFCATMVIEDKDSGLISALQIVDKLQTVSIPIQQPTPPGQAIAVLWPGLVILAAWLAEPEDQLGDEYELEIRFLLPDGQPQELSKGIFRIGTPDPSKPLYRFMSRFTVPPQMNVPGMWLVESRIRKTDAQTWKSQSSPIMVEVLPPPPQVQPTANGNPSSSQPSS